MRKMTLFFFILAVSLQSRADSDDALRTKISMENEVLSILHNDLKPMTGDGRDVDVNQYTSPWDKMNEFLSLSTIDEYFF